MNGFKRGRLLKRPRKPEMIEPKMVDIASRYTT